MPDSPVVRGRLLVWLLVVGLGVAVWTGLAVNARATVAARTTADEPHYLLTAISLWQDHDITTGDELQARAYTPFHEVQLLDQTTPLADGRLVEPHDPLLPAILALPVAIGGWVGAKLTLAAVAGFLAATMIWVAVRRFAVPLTIATVTVIAFSLAMPLSAYATQIYPEMPAALAVALAIGALTGPLGRRGIALWIAVLVCLPWLSVKYAPVVVALAAIGAVLLWRRGSRRALVVSAVVLMVAGLTYLLAHKVMYGGWTVYAAGDHFTEGGQLSVMGYEANYPGRTIRLLGLLVDRNFGLVAWAPVYLIAVGRVRGVASCPAPRLGRAGGAARRGLDQRHVDRADDAGLVVARSSARRRVADRRDRDGVVRGARPVRAVGGGGVWVPSAS